MSAIHHLYFSRFIVLHACTTVRACVRLLAHVLNSLVRLACLSLHFSLSLALSFSFTLSLSLFIPLFRSLFRSHTHTHTHTHTLTVLPACTEHHRARGGGMRQVTTDEPPARAQDWPGRQTARNRSVGSWSFAHHDCGNGSSAGWLVHCQSHTHTHTHTHTHANHAHC